jgi:hypothetical protein
LEKSADFFEIFFCAGLGDRRKSIRMDILWDYFTAEVAEAAQRWGKEDRFGGGQLVLTKLEFVDLCCCAGATDQLNMPSVFDLRRKRDNFPAPYEHHLPDRQR